MYCPICRSKETKVVDSRLSTEGMTVRRRRECVSCAFRFSTAEETELLDVTVVKSDGRRASYDRQKLTRGMVQSLTKRPYTKEKFHRLIHTIERDIQKKKKREVTSEEIGEIIMKHLKRFDTVAYIRFASIYRAFEDVHTFQSEISSLQKNRHSTARPSKKRKT
jgi:transcriptional repressor NrdR